jgi:hypothetical protein
MLDGATGKPRTIINIDTAKLTAEEGPNAPRFVKYRGQTVGAGPYRREKEPAQEFRGYQHGQIHFWITYPKQPG